MMALNFDEFEIGKMQKNDLQFLPELFSDYVENSNEQVMENIHKEFEKYKDSEFYHFVVIRHRNKTIGYAEIFLHPNILCDQKLAMTIWKIRIREEYRSKGLGGKLLEYCESFGRSKGTQWCLIQAKLSNKGAQKFYERNGYEKDAGYFKDLTIQGINSMED